MPSDQVILAKRGPLERVWLASHWERKVSKSQFLQTNLEKTIDAITTDQDEPLALRISGQLLLGVVRIYSRKTRYLLEDCNEALVKIKLTFKKGDVNMPDIQQSVASLNAITLPERLTEFDILLPDTPFNAAPWSGRDPVLDSLSMSQDITLNDMSFGDNSWAFDGIDQGRHLLEGEQGGGIGADVLGLDFSDREQGVRDTDMLGDRSFTMEEIGEPLKDMQLEDSEKQANRNDNNAFHFDDDFLDYDFDFGEADQRLPQQEHHTATDMDGTLSTLMESGITRDLDAEAAMTASPVRRRRRLVVDKVTEIPHEEIRQRMNDTSTIVDKTANLGKPKRTVVQPNLTTPSCSVGIEMEQFVSGLTRKRRASMALDTAQKEARVEDLAFDNDMTVEQPARVDPVGDQGYNYDLDYDFDSFEAGPEVRPDATSDDNMLTQATQATQFSRHTRQTLEVLQDKLSTASSVKFGELVSSTNSKAEAARLFYDVLVLSTKNMVKVKQTQSFGEIQIRQ
ncbi:sister chromatid cohesion protein 1 [Apophysomyces sp. BC1034]|nr:sister chromatid cohesion protein 1 [Apophysomyces sp. BC1015]KAG0179152.1 sister chromatid cohesion protein 1 [Apophysomyces sp. BC1021]KAG0187849.1 sister chromatid cohesion protein 1 [Apophysomyces sp. BC1034]